MPDFSFFEIGTRRKLTLINPKGQNTQCDMLLQQIVVKYHPLCTGWATSSAPSHSTKSLCVYWRISAKIFVSATEVCCRKMLHKFNLIDSVRLDAMTKFCCGDKKFCKNSKVHTKWFVAATCCLVCSLPTVFKCCFWKTFQLNTNFRTKHWEWRYYMYLYETVIF